MLFWDNTQKLLVAYLKKTEQIMNSLLNGAPFYGGAAILPNVDLGFPHDVIRLAGGFATGIYVAWDSRIPFVPIDICMNACTVSIYEVDGDACCFSQEKISTLLSKLEASSYKANFHRGNHFISYSESKLSHKKYIILHSSAAEFETLYNGLYPVEGNFFYDRTKTYFALGRYLRYIDGKDAELFLSMASDLYLFNENRHDFIAASLLDGEEKIVNEVHFHHYGMPSPTEALLGSHILKCGQVSPLLTRPGENIYLIQYEKAQTQELCIGDRFITPHGLGKQHVGKTNIQVDPERGMMKLDNFEYKIQYGESLRNHPYLELRNIEMSKYLKYYSQIYKYKILDEYIQLASFNKLGFIQWRSN